VDIAGDIFDLAVQARIREVRLRTILCCNVFEHVNDRPSLARFCAEMIPTGGYMVFSGPYSYPYHPDPVDNLFRPTPAEAAAMFPGFDIVAADIVKSTTWGAEILEQPGQIPRLALYSAVRLLKFWAGRDKYFEENHRLLWLFRRFKVTCVILRKRDSFAAAPSKDASRDHFCPALELRANKRDRMRSRQHRAWTAAVQYSCGRSGTSPNPAVHPRRHTARRGWLDRSAVCPGCRT